METQQAQQPLVPAIELNELLDLPEDAYNANDEAVRATWLKLIAQSPAHLAAYRAGLIEPTEAMVFGRFAHAFVLEPDLVGSRFYREPEVDRRTKVGKDLLAALAAKHHGKIAVRESKYDLAVKIRDAVYAHRAARKLLEYEGRFEASLFWNNQDTSLLCRARFDKISPKGNFIVDLKTTIDASPAAFAKTAVNLMYPQQAAHYTEPNALRFCLIACEKAEPFGVSVYAAGDDTLKLGQRHRAPNMRRFAECTSSGQWPGYDDGSIQRLVLPRWAA